MQILEICKSKDILLPKIFKRALNLKGGLISIYLVKALSILLSKYNTEESCVCLQK